MKRLSRVLTTVVTLILLLSLPSCQAQEPPVPGSLPPIEVYFSPKGGCTEAVVKEINAAKKPRFLSRHTVSPRLPSPRPSSMPTRVALTSG